MSPGNSLPLSPLPCKSRQSTLFLVLHFFVCSACMNLSPVGTANPGAFKVDMSAPAEVVTLRVWLFFQLAGGHILLPILVATFTFSKAKRHTTLINMCFTWIISSVISCLLFYADQYNSTPNPVLCTAQASVVYASAPMVAASAFSLIYHVWYTAHSSVTTFHGSSRSSTSRSVFLLVFPYISFIGFVIPGALLATSHPQDVSVTRRVLYCSLHHHLFSGIISVYTAVILLATVYYEVRIIVILRRNWVGLRNSGIHVAMDVQLVLRVIVFGLFVILGFALAISTIFFATVIPDIFTATVPVVIFFVFGLSMDVLRVWSFSTPGPQDMPSKPEIKMASPC